MDAKRAERRRIKALRRKQKSKKSYRPWVPNRLAALRRNGEVQTLGRLSKMHRTLWAGGAPTCADCKGALAIGDRVIVNEGADGLHEIVCEQPCPAKRRLAESAEAP